MHGSWSVSRDGPSDRESGSRFKTGVIVQHCQKYLYPADLERHLLGQTLTPEVHPGARVVLIKATSFHLEQQGSGEKKRSLRLI